MVEKPAKKKLGPASKRPAKEILLKAYRGRSLAEAARILGVAASTTSRWLAEVGIDRNRAGKTIRLTKLRCRSGNYRQKEWLEQQYVTLKKTMKQIAKETGASQRTICGWLHKHGIPTRKSSEVHSLRHVDCYGYVRVRTESGKYKREHRLVMEKILGRPLSKKEIVHHVNGNKQDNRPSNLRLLPQRMHNSTLHLREQLATAEGEISKLRAQLHAAKEETSRILSLFASRGHVRLGLVPMST